MMRHQRLEPGTEVRVTQIAYAQRPARHLILVGRADTTAGGADGVIAAGFFPGLIQGHVAGQDQWTGGTHPQTLGHRHATVLQHLHLFHQRVRRHHHAVANKTSHPLAHDSRGNQMQHRAFTVDHQGVTGIVTALKAHHRGDPIGQQVDDFTLALVAPLGADDHQCFTLVCHIILYPRQASSQAANRRRHAPADAVP